jgi:hypothetical protein
VKIDRSVPLTAIELFEMQQKPIHQIARDGDVELFGKLVKLLTPDGARKKVNALDGEKLAPLHYAARYHHLAMAKALVASGADVNVRGAEGLTPLHYAAK